MTQDKLDPVRIGIVSISDRASTGVYEDKGLPALKDWLTRALKNPITFEARLIPDEKDASAPRSSNWWTPAARWCSPPAAPARRRAT